LSKREWWSKAMKKWNASFSELLRLRLFKQSLKIFPKLTTNHFHPRKKWKDLKLLYNQLKKNRWKMNN
jgi:hypothetical protein